MFGAWLMAFMEWLQCFRARSTAEWMLAEHGDDILALTREERRLILSEMQQEDPSLGQELGRILSARRLVRC